MSAALLGGVLVGGLIGGLVGPEVAAAGIGAPGVASPESERELVERYAPVVIIRQQAEPCDSDGESFTPAPVDIVLDNPEVFLRQVGNGDPVAVVGPSARELYGLGGGWYLDFPGDALDPGCVFEQDYRKFSDGRSVVYANIATEDARPGYLAVQYWMFWYHNTAKNNHEGDWEMVQVLFDVGTVAEALASTPIAVGYAQHEGGERATWQDGKLEREGDRVVVYAARGSHASYFDAALFLGRSGGEGFGCDNTTGPSQRLDPEVVLLPDRVTDPDDPFAWLTFTGRWGQREAGFFNGPTGPYEKARWREPVTWHENLRSSSVEIPAGDRVGNGTVRVFCTAVDIGSSALTSTVRSPITGLVVLVLVLWLATKVARATTWSPVTTHPLRQQRSVGQILRASWRVWLTEPRAMLAVGLIYIPVAIATSAVQGALLTVPFLRGLVDLAGDRSGLAMLLSILVGGLADLLAFVYVAAVVARVVAREGSADDQRRVALSFDEVRELLTAVTRAIVVVGALLLSIVGIPWALRQLVRYQFVPQVVALEGVPGDRALARSSELVRGRWWWIAAVVIGIEIVVTVTGFAAAIGVLLTFRTLPLWAFNIVAGVIFVALVPIGATAVAYAYGTVVAGRGEPEDDPIDASNTTDPVDGVAAAAP